MDTSKMSNAQPVVAKTTVTTKHKFQLPMIVGGVALGFIIIAVGYWWYYKKYSKHASSLSTGNSQSSSYSTSTSQVNSNLHLARSLAQAGVLYRQNPLEQELHPVLVHDEYDLTEVQPLSDDEEHNLHTA